MTKKKIDVPSSELFSEPDFLDPFAEPEALKPEPVEETPKEKEKEPEPAPEKPADNLSEEQKAEYLTIFDAIMFEGVYRKNVQIGKKYAATLCTRTASDDNRISMALDRLKFQTVLAYQNMATLLSLSYSLEAFGTRDFSDLDPNERYEAILALPSTAVVLLSDELLKFDSMVMKALEYGQENF